MAPSPRSKGPDPILLTLFANRFMSVAEAMGRSLQQTSISTNIKERLDFSCALFAPDGDLVANAPFIPIHLGSMSFAVKYQMQLHGKSLKEGDVLMTNSPHAGGSHLPDITIISPVFDSQSKEIIFFTASRGHHADIGGILPGSMPPTSVNIFEEGANIESFKLVDGGVFNKEGLYEYMLDKPAQYPGSSGCRNIRDVESDLKAQIAANHKGIQLIHAIVDDYGLPTVQEYMYHIRTNAENAVRNLLRAVAQRAGTPTLAAVDYLDDGSPIELKVEIDVARGSAVLDFSGTGCEVRGNLNAPISVVHSAVIYCMRSMLDLDIPLNAGCLVPLDIRIPQGSLLAPSRTAAVCGGNVLTSQRIVDVVLRAFHACAASQGCTNNLTFGAGGKDADGHNVAGWGYYETIAGGSGAGPGWHGTSGVHTHITNTRIGDVEILERRYPVLVHTFGRRTSLSSRFLITICQQYINPLLKTCIVDPFQFQAMNKTKVAPAGADRYAILQRKLEDLERVHVDAKKSYQTDAARLKSELARAQKENAEHVQRLDKLKKQQDASDARIKELKQMNVADQATIKDLRAKLRSTENERTQLQSKQDDIGGAKKALQEVETKRREEARRHEQRITELEKSLASEKRHRDAADKKVLELQSKLDEDSTQAREGTRRAESQAKDAQAAKQEALRSLQALRDEASEKQEEMLSQIDALRSTLQRVAAEYGRLASSSVTKAAHDVLKNEHAALQIRSWRLERKLANAEGQVVEVANLVRQTKDDNDMLRSLLAASDEAAAFYSSACKWMRMNPQDPATSTPEDDLRAQVYNAQLDAMHAQLEVKDTVLSIAESCSQFSSCLSTDILSSHRSLVLQLDQERATIKKLNRDLDTAKSSRDVLSANLKSLRAEHEADLGRLAELKASLVASEANALALTNEAKTAESRLLEIHAGHEKALKKERETIQRLSTTIHQHKTAEEALRAEIDQLTSELTDAERYQEAYHNLVEEVESLIARNQLAEDEAARLSKFNVEILSHHNPAQRIMYLDRVRRELAEVRQDLLSMTRDRDNIAAYSETLQHELDTYKSVSLATEKPRTTVTRITRVPLGMHSTNVSVAPTRSISSSVSKGTDVPTYDIHDEMMLDELTGTWDEP